MTQSAHFLADTATPQPPVFPLQICLSSSLTTRQGCSRQPWDPLGRSSANDSLPWHRAGDHHRRPPRSDEPRKGRALPSDDRCRRAETLKPWSPRLWTAFQEGRRRPAESRVLGSVEGECPALCMVVVTFITWRCRASLSFLPRRHKLQCVHRLLFWCLVYPPPPSLSLLLPPFWFLPLYSIPLRYGNRVRRARAFH